jgi:quercetin dioxygenase-like cupin family protein
VGPADPSLEVLIGQTSHMISVVLECVDLDAEVVCFTEQLGFRIHLVTPADDPRCIVVERGDTRLRIQRAAADAPIELEIDVDVAHDPVITPGGTTVRWAVVDPLVVVPDNNPGLVVTGSGDGGFGVGRAGMAYRDLLPDRWGGRFIASHIRIEDGGDVADWVHFHRIRFQMIFVAAGWVDVVYEDQGEPFRMHAGDCVLQPPEIRHRVLRSSPGLEVIEIGCPAEHDTLADHGLELPTSQLRPERDFGGQRFVRHVAADVPDAEFVDPALRVRDTGIGHATEGLAGAVVVSAAGSSTAPLTHDGEFVMLVGLAGTATLTVDSHTFEFPQRASVAIPSGTIWAWSKMSVDHEVLVVSLPVDAVRPA